MKIKWTNVRWLPAFLSLALGVAITCADNTCTDSTSYTAWECLLSGSLTNTAGLTFTNLSVCAGAEIVPPVGTNIYFSLGQKRGWLHHACIEFQNQDHWVTNDVVYTNGMYFDPTIPNSISNSVTNTYTAYVVGTPTPNDGVCPPVTNVLGYLTIQVATSPSITTPPTNQTQCAGQAVNFFVGAAGTTPLTYQWRTNGVNLTNSTHISGATTATLTITNLTAGDAGSYSVVVGNSCGSVTSAVATLTVNLPPAITQSLTNQTVCPGSTTTFSVMATNGVPISYQWKFGTNVLAGQTNSSLVLSNVYQGNAGNYTVTVTNTCGSTNSTATLTVRTNLSVAGPTSLSVCSGSMATFNVTAYGSGPFSYVWKFGTNTLADKTNSSLAVLHADSTNSGSYSVIVSAACGSVTKSATLITLAIVSQPASQTVTNGQNATFSVSATGYDAIAYQWRKNGVNISGANDSFYTVIEPSISDSGSTYSIIASSPDCSLTSSNAILTVTAPPPTSPAIVSGPESQSARRGDDAAFSVIATGTQPLVYQWRFNGTNISGATNNSYIRYNVQPGHAGDYSVVVTNLAGSVTSSNAALTVVGVDRVVLDGADPEIQGYITNILGTTYTLRAIPSPATAPFPGGIPVWTIQSQPAGSGLPTNLGAGLTVSVTPTNVGSYIIRATCGTSTADFTIVSVSLEDPDYDGVSSQQELLDGTDPNNPDDVVPYQLASWKFDSTNWIGVTGQLPLTFTNVTSIRGVSGNSVLVNTNAASKAWLNYRETEPNSPIANFNCRKGTVSFWFKPDWVSGAIDGTGPTNDARLIELGTKGSTNGCWGLYLGSRGTNIYFCTQTNSTATLWTNLIRGISWNSNNWHHVALTYCPTNSRLYIDGQLVVTNGAGVTNWPGLSVRTNGFCVGSARGGTNQACGRFDNLNLCNYQRSSTNILNEDATTCFEGMDVVLVMDHSGSMQGTKIADAKTAASNFVARLDFDEDKAGVVAFNDAPTIPLPQELTNNFNAIIKAITNLSASGYTRIDRGITNGTGELLSIRHSAGALPVMVVLSDGSNNVQNITSEQLQQFNSNTLYAASAAWSNAIRVVSIALGSDADTNLMRQIATSADLYYYAYQSDQLDSVFSAISSLLCRNATNPPSVSIISPTNGQVLNRSIAFPIKALASDPKNALVGVKFYADSAYLGQVSFGAATDGGTIYTLNWTPLIVGTHILTAIATNESGLTATSAPVTISVVSAAPTISIITPQNNAQSDAITNIRLTSVAEDWDGTVTNVSYYMNGGYIGSSTLSPYVLLKNDLHAGIYVFHAVARDDDGYAGVSQYVTNIVNQRFPTVQFTVPHSNDLFAVGENILMVAQATDADGYISSVQFKVGNTPLGYGVLTSNNLYYLTWSNAPQTFPSTNLYVVATDNDYLTATATNMIRVGDCSIFGVSNLVLSVSEILGGNQLSGTVILSNPATTGGQAITLSNNSPFLSVPASVYITDGQRSNSFVIGTTVVGSTNITMIGASYHGQPLKWPCPDCVDRM